MQDLELFAKNQSLLFFVLFCIVFLISTLASVFIFMYRKQFKQNESLTKQNNDLYKQNLDLNKDTIKVMSKLDSTMETLGERLESQLSRLERGQEQIHSDQDDNFDQIKGLLHEIKNNTNICAFKRSLKGGEDNVRPE